MTDVIKITHPKILSCISKTGYKKIPYHRLSTNTYIEWFINSTMQAHF